MSGPGLIPGTSACPRKSWTAAAFRMAIDAWYANCFLRFGLSSPAERTDRGGAAARGLPHEAKAVFFDDLPCRPVGALFPRTFDVRRKGPRPAPQHPYGFLPDCGRRGAGGADLEGRRLRRIRPESRPSRKGDVASRLRRPVPVAGRQCPRRRETAKRGAPAVVHAGAHGRSGNLVRERRKGHGGASVAGGRRKAADGGPGEKGPPGEADHRGGPAGAQGGGIF
ncbi:MAG: hypothetical protein A4E73_02840 [Syntrophaceae bacterium PtaU1.Bin231]|nr:MAG: hypothetical protein A4E73_02840 [Syntrophaceae bacterium PtaU1.Bin231]